MGFIQRLPLENPSGIQTVLVRVCCAYAVRGRIATDRLTSEAAHFDRRAGKMSRLEQEKLVGYPSG